MKRFYMRRCLLFFFFAVVAGFSSWGQINMATTGSNTQNFNTLPTSGTTTWTDNSTIANWYSQRTGTGTSIVADGGTNTGGNLYSYGTGTNTDRALGTIGSGNAAAGSFAHGVQLRNTSGAAITDIKVTYTLEQWRNSTAAAQSITAYYKISSSAITALNPNSNATWTAIPGLTLNSPITGGAAGALDGNNGANRVTATAVSIPSLSLANGDYIMIKWEDPDHTGTDHGLSIDDVTIDWTIPVSNNANLSNLALSTGSLTPPFASATTSYTSTVANAVSSITVTPTTADVNATVTVNGTPVTSGNPSGSIALNVGSNIITVVVTAPDLITTKTYTVDVTRQAPGVATLTITSPLPDFGNVCINTTTSPGSFTLDGSSLDGSNISLSALAGFSYSLSAGGPFNSTLSFSYTGGGFTGQLIYVVFNPTAVQSYSGNIVLNGGGVSNFNVAAAGIGVNSAPTVTTGTSSSVGATSAVCAGTIPATGCSAITDYGIEFSSTNGFPDGTGTKVSSTNLSGINFSSTLSGLAPNTRYYYKAYATTASTTVYGTQQFFTCTPLPVIMSGQPSFSYTENFSDIANWTNFFISGTGANHFGGLSATGSGGIPNGTTITASTQSFQGAGSASGGVHRGTDQSPSSTSIVLLSTGASPENSTSAAIDFYLDFTGVNAGTLSFDYSTIINGTGDRKGSVRVYTTTDGITFTELTFASVLNLANGAPVTSGSKNNIALPSSFNNSPTARIRFYYSNGTGGTTGSRPKISIDNLNVTAVATTPCSSPTAAPTALTFGTITDVSIQGSFTAASPASDGYVVVMSTNSSLTSNPTDGTIYNIGDNLGDGSVISTGASTSFTATGLTPLTTYYFFIFSMNNVCTGGPLYYTATVLNGQATTIAGLPPCSAPAGQPTNLVFGSPGVNSIPGSFTATTADEYLVLRSTSSSLSNNPVNGQVYNTGDVLGNATVVERGTSTSFTANGLLSNTLYYFYVFAINSQNCVNGPAYNIVSPLTGSQSTQPLPPCSTPTTQPTALTFNASNTAVSGAFTPSTGGADNYLVVMSTSSSLSTLPVDNTDYNSGDALGGGTVVGNSPINSFVITGLTSGTTYYFYIFAENKNCSGGTKYLTSSPLTGSKVTGTDPVLNFYFGTLHSHSDYSDGNKDHPGYTPTDDYTYAQTAQCMDYLGISEHNHFSSVDNPGNVISNYHLGPVQANNYTTAHPGFLALYGMEWGVISGGGHVVVYGDGLDQLWGWETGAGGWGPTDNYDVFVPKNVYTGSTGLFKTVNDNVSLNAFATLAHPNSGDYNNIANIAYDAVADAAIVGAAVESGPATSTNTTYSNPGSSMSYLSYYRTMLARGYHLGPVIDHDNHNTTFGHTTYSRTAVLSPALTKTDFISSVRNMRFYATQDCDTKVDFTINTKEMGSVLTDRYGPAISVLMTDVSTNLSSAVIRVMAGTPGSGTTAVKIDSAIGPSLNWVDQSLANMATGYYYIDISIGSARIVTSPIWYTRNDGNIALPVTLVSFTAEKLNTSALLKWTTSQELNSSRFIVERSGTGTDWQPIATVMAAGNSALPIDYSAIDQHPAKGMNLYRLKMVDLDNQTKYSAIRRVNFEAPYTLTVYPNPAAKTLQVATDNANWLNGGTLNVVDMRGEILLTKQLNNSAAVIQLNIENLSAGIYILQVTDKTGAVRRLKFVKE